VDGADFSAFRFAFGGASAAFDFDNSGYVDGTDFGRFRSQFGSALS